MSNLPGTNLIAPIAPFSDNDDYPTHDEKYGKGGYRAVADATARDAIKKSRLVLGMAVRTLSDNIVWILTTMPGASENLSAANWTNEVDTLKMDGGTF